MGTLKNKFRIRGIFSRPQKVAVNRPQFTTIPPQTHQQKTTFQTPFFRKNPCKNTQNRLKKKTPLPSLKSRASDGDYSLDILSPLV
jgi:hypothetical protein